MIFLSRYRRDMPSYSMLMVRTVVFYLFEDCFRQKIYDKIKYINEPIISYFPFQGTKIFENIPLRQKRSI